MATLIDGLSGTLAVAFGVKYSPDMGIYYFLNYRVERDLLDWQILWLSVGLLLFALGIYGGAVVVRQFCPRRVPTFEPALLVGGGIAGLFAGCSMQWYALADLPMDIFLWSSWRLGIIGSLLGMLLACQVKFRRALGPRVNLLRIGFPLMLILLLFLLNFTSFPGVKATAQSRQQWASRHFPLYDNQVSYLKRCPPIVKRVGKVEFIAPTKGVNFFATEGGSGQHGEHTLEIIGSTGTGVAHFKFGMAGGFDEVQFTQNNKTENLSCFNPK